VQVASRTTYFAADIKKGKEGEKIFVEDFLEFMKIKFNDVSGEQKFQIMDTDYTSQLGMYEIKANYKDDGKIYIEEYTNYNKELGPIKEGWFFKTKADTLVFVSKATRTMIIIPFTGEFKNHYEKIKQKYPLKLNAVSVRGKSKWQSAFRCIPLSELEGFYSEYRKPSSE